LAVAVMGVIMVADFSAHVNAELANTPMPASTRAELQSDANKLAALEPPTGVEPETAAAIESSIADAFIASFRLMMWICAALSLASSAVAFRWIARVAKVSVPERVGAA
jgi:hypothetical protein